MVRIGVSFEVLIRIGDLGEVTIGILIGDRSPIGIRD